MIVSHDVSANERKILEAVNRAAQDKVDFLITPEGSVSGYHSKFDSNEVAQSVKTITEIARKAQVGLALGTCFKEKNGNDCYNEVRMYSPEGEYLGIHSKILRCSTAQDPNGGEVAEYKTTPLRTFQWKNINIGILICNDLWATPGFTQIPNPYLASQLKQMGAQVIFHSINSGTDLRYQAFHESSAELWARTLQMPIVEVNASAENDGFINAPTGVISTDGSRVAVVPNKGENYFTYDLSLS